MTFGTWHRRRIAICSVAICLGSITVQVSAEEIRAEEPSTSPPAPADSAPEADPPPEEAGGSSTGPPPDVEVLRVRGRGLAAIQTEVPSSVTSFDAATIEALGAQDVSDLSRVTPSVSIVQPGATQATFFIRGVGLSDFGSNAAGAVSIFQDGVALNAPAIQTGQLFDVEGVDIVRGPQGTGHFRNASAGAIRVRSWRPTGNYGAQLRATLGRFAADGGKGAHHAVIQEYEGFLEAPLVDDQLATRLAFRFRDAGPYKTNDCGNAPPLVADPTGEAGRIPRPSRAEERQLGLRGKEQVDDFIDICGERGPSMLPFATGSISQIPTGQPRRVGDEHNWAARGSLRLTPEESDWDLILNAHGSRLDQDPAMGQAIGTSFFRFADDTRFGGQTSDAAGGYQEPDILEEFQRRCGEIVNGDCTRDPHAGRTVARNLTRERPLDIRPFRGDYTFVGHERRDAYGAYLSADGRLGDYDLSLLFSYDAYERSRLQDVDFTPDELITQNDTNEAWQTYEEVRLSGELPAHPFAWELGAYYLYEDLDVFVDTDINSGVIFDRDYDQQIHSIGLWSGFSWDFLDSLTLEGGVRWNFERKDFDFKRNDNFGTASTVQHETWSEPTGELILTYHLDERSQAYLRYTRGWKAGHYNAQAAQRFDTLLAEPETNDAWELGLRGGWWDGRIQGASAFFYYHYEQYQVFLFSDLPLQPPTLEIVNAEEAELFGVEVEGRLRPLEGLAPRWIEGLTLTGNFSWNQGQYVDFQQELSFLIGGRFNTRTLDFSGNKLANAPRYKASGSAEWTFELGRWGYLIPRYDVSWTDEQFFEPNEGRGSIRFSGEEKLPELAIGQAAFFLHHVRLAYRAPTGNVEIAAWMRNVSDQVYKTFAFDASRLNGVVLNFVGEPRTIGVDFIVRF